MTVVNRYIGRTSTSQIRRHHNKKFYKAAYISGYSYHQYLFVIWFFFSLFSLKKNGIIFFLNSYKTLSDKVYWQGCIFCFSFITLYQVILVQWVFGVTMSRLSYFQLHCCCFQYPWSAPLPHQQRKSLSLSLYAPHWPIIICWFMVIFFPSL